MADDQTEGSDWATNDEKSGRDHAGWAMAGVSVWDASGTTVGDRFVEIVWVFRWSTPES